MKNKKGSAILWIVLIILIVAAGATFYFIQTKGITPEEMGVECIRDSDCNDGFKCGVDDVFAELKDDCVPVEGCHPNYCINKDFKEDDDGGRFCSFGCDSILDCGAGECILDNGRCAAEEFSSGNRSYHPDAFTCIEIGAMG